MFYTLIELSIGIKPNGTQVMKHDECGPKLFIQWTLGWHKAWAYGPGGPRAWPWTKGLGL